MNKKILEDGNIICTAKDWLNNAEIPVGFTYKSISINGRSIIGLYPKDENYVTVIFNSKESAVVDANYLIKVIFK